MVNSLVAGAKAVLEEYGTRIELHVVPGSYELPFAAKSLALRGYDAVIAIGVLIKGETMHFEYISSAVSDGLMKAQLETGVPIVFGVLTCLTEEQALKRAGFNGGHNHGEDWGVAALDMTRFSFAGHN